MTMKSQDIGRGVTSRRRSGSPLELGRVAKVRAHALPPVHDGRRRHRRDTKERRRGLLILSVFLASGAMAIIGVAVALWLLPRLGHGKAAVAEQVAKAVAAAPDLPRPDRDEALRLVRRALETRNPAKVPDFFRMGSASADEIVNFLRDSETKDGLLAGCEWQSTMDTDGMVAEGVVAGFNGGSGARQRLAFLTPDKQGRWQVDFDAYARTVSPDWRMLRTGSDKGMVRGFLAPDFYYNGAFSNESDWQSYAVSSPDSSQALRGYCKRRTPLAAALEELFTGDRKLARCTVELRSVTGGAPLQYEITRLRSHDWIVPDEPAAEVR